MNKKQARERAKRDISCLDVGGFAIVRQAIGGDLYDFVPVGKNCSSLVVEQWRYNGAANKWEKQNIARRK